MIRGLKSTKFILTAFIVLVSIVLLSLHIISGDQLVSILQIIIPAYFASNTIAGHRAFSGDKNKDNTGTAGMIVKGSPDDR
jgi:hypothetical protein